MVKRTKEHVLEKESALALEALLPSEWILRDMKPDYGLDKELTIVEGEDVTNKVVWLQLKATEKLKPNQKSISYDFETKHLKYWETCRLPVIVLYWIKSKNEFYYLFAQRYIKETLSPSKPEWRNQKTVSVAFPLESKLVDTESLTAIATEGHFYVMQQQLTQQAGLGPHYWLDGIPKSDDTKLKEYTLKALEYASKENHPAAIELLQKALKECTVAPTEKMSLLLNLGNEYHCLSQNEEALSNYVAMLQLVDSVPKMEAMEGRSTALGNMGMVYSHKGKLHQALKYHEDALQIDRALGHKHGEALDLNNIGLAYAAECDFHKALRYYEDALNIEREIGYRLGEAATLCNIGLIHQKNANLKQALKYHIDALKILREVGHRQGEASALGNIGTIYLDRGDLDQAMRYQKDALQMLREIGYRRGEADVLATMGRIHSQRGDLSQALEYHKDALKIHREIGYKQGEADVSGNIGLIYRAKGDLDEALVCHEDALKIHRQIGYKLGEAQDRIAIGLVFAVQGNVSEALLFCETAVKIHKEIGFRQGEAVALGNIGLIYLDEGDLGKALEYSRDALKIHRQIGYKLGEASGLGNIGLIHEEKGDFGQALRYMEQALEMFKEMGMPEQIRITREHTKRISQQVKQRKQK